MRRFLNWPRAGLVVVMAVLAGGCDSASPYRTLLRDQASNLEELEKILETVTDKASMKAARGRLDVRFETFERTRERALALPPPTQDLRQRVQEEGEKLRQALEKVQQQVRRIQALPDGEDFLGGFEKRLLGDRAS